MTAENATGTEDKVVGMKTGESSKRKHMRSAIAFPYMNLNEAINLARAIHNNTGTNPCTLDQLAAWVNQSATASTFRSRLSSAKLFGLIDAENLDALRLNELGRLVVDAKREREGRARAFLNVPLYAALHNKFKGFSIPSGLALEGELVALGVADTLKATARRVLESSAEQAGFFDAGRDRLVAPGYGQSAPQDDHPPPSDDTGKGGGGGSDDVGLNLDPLLIALLKKIPPTNDGWPAAKRIRWFKTFAMNVSQIYDGDDDPVEMKVELEGATTERSPRSD